MYVAFISNALIKKFFIFSNLAVVSDQNFANMFTIFLKHTVTKMFVIDLVIKYISNLNYMLCLIIIYGLKIEVNFDSVY